MKETNSGADAPEILTFEKDKAGQRIYDVENAKLAENVTVMTLDRLVALAAQFGTPHFRWGKLHYAYIPYNVIVVAHEDETATKPAGTFEPSLRVHCDAGVQAAPSIEVRA